MSSSDPENFEASPFAFGEDLVQSPVHKPAGDSEEGFDGLLSTPLRLHQDLKEGCGGQLWPAGMVLSKYMLRQHREGLMGKSIVELGSGGGLVGLAVAIGCKTDQPLYITDQLPMFALMEKNIALNGLDAKVKAAVFDWGTPVPANVPAKPDVILAADCVYFEPSFPLLLQTLKDLIGPNTVCYFCFKKRRRADMQFMKSARKTFNVEDVDDPYDTEYKKESIFLYKITLKQP